MKLQLSPVLAILVAQTALNVLLASWLYLEYVHNRFMQEFMAEFWSINAIPVSLGIVAVGAIAGGSFFVFSRRQTEDGLASKKPAETSAGFMPLDMCPFCNIGLVTLSDNRFQCRKCHRYFKK